MIFIDFETRSLADLPNVGGRNYARDPSGELLVACAVDATRDPAPVYCWSGWLKAGVQIRGWEVPPNELAEIGFPANAVRWIDPHHDIPAPILVAVHDGVPLVAQNADAFDRNVWNELGYPEAKFVDTMPLFARRGLPRGLDKCGQALFGVGKDGLGQKLMQMSCIPQKKGVMKGQWIAPDSARLSRIARYCARDALLAAAIWYEERLGDPDPDDPILELHRRINDRGIPVDVQAARRLRAEDLRQRALACQRAHKATNGKVTETTLNSPVQLRGWFKTKGIDVLDCQRETMLAVRKGKHGDVDEAVLTVVEARLAVSSITGGKIDSLLRRTCPDGRLRDWGVYYGAHTGRWSARGVQVQNLAGAKVEVTEDVYDEPSQAPKVAKEEEVDLVEVFKSMLKGLFIAPPEIPGAELGIVDLKAIEARVTAWVAQDWDDLQVYVRGEDPYIKLAATIFGVPASEIDKKDIRRQVGKAGVLSSGYQGGPNAILKMLPKIGLTEADLIKVGASPEKIVEGWRDDHPLVAGKRRGTWKTPEGKLVITRKGGLWRDTKEAVERIARGESNEEEACRCKWIRDGAHLFCVLPSGRPVIYREVAYEKVPDRWGGMSESITYLSARGVRIPTYGGKLVENVVQAICRDLLAEPMLAMEREGIQTLLHCHDEFVFVNRPNSRDYDRAVELITTTPAWMPGMVIGANGEKSRRYAKP